MNEQKQWCPHTQWNTRQLYKRGSTIICGNTDEPTEFMSHETSQAEPNKHRMISRDYEEDLIGD